MRSRHELLATRHVAVLLICLNLSACAAQLVVRPERAVLAEPDSSILIQWSSKRLASLALDGEPIPAEGSVQLALAPDVCERSVQFEGRAASSASLTRRARLLRGPRMVGVTLIEEHSPRRETPAQQVASGPGDLPRLRVRMGESGFAALAVGVSCARLCEFVRVTADGQAGSRNRVSAGGGVCVHQIGDPIRLDRLFRVQVVGVSGLESEPFLVEVLN